MPSSTPSLHVGHSIYWIGCRLFDGELSSIDLILRDTALKECVKKKVKRGQVYCMCVCLAVSRLRMLTSVYLLYLQSPTVSYLPCFALDFDISSYSLYS